jgi:hypothetical protein
MQAFRLYGEAAAAGAAGARANQAAIYERALTPEQRQQALDAETARLAGATR